MADPWSDKVERAVSAAEMGIDTCLVSSLSSDIESRLLIELGERAKYDPRYGVSAWVFPDGGELLLGSNVRDTLSAYRRRHRSKPNPSPEIVRA